MSLSRRRLFGLFAGAAAAPLIPVAPVAEVVTRYVHKSYGLGFAVTPATNRLLTPKEAGDFVVAAWRKSYAEVVADAYQEADA